MVENCTVEDLGQNYKANYRCGASGNQTEVRVVEKRRKNDEVIWSYVMRPGGIMCEQNFEFLNLTNFLPAEFLQNGTELDCTKLNISGYFFGLFLNLETDANSCILYEWCPMNRIISIEFVLLLSADIY